MDFQQRLYEMRKQSSLSQEGLASLLGVTRQAVQKWESGSSRPDMDNLAALARYFNVSLDYLVTGQERTAPPPAATTIIHNHYSRWHYEYKSSRTLFGLPLIHIRLGERGLCTARGIIAIGNCAVGALSIGGFSFGLVSVGGLSLGLLFSLACTRPEELPPPQRSPSEERPPPLWPSGRWRKGPSPSVWVLTRRRWPRPSGKRLTVCPGFSRSS